MLLEKVEYDSLTSLVNALANVAELTGPTVPLPTGEPERLQVEIEKANERLLWVYLETQNMIKQNLSLRVPYELIMEAARQTLLPVIGDAGAIGIIDEEGNLLLPEIID